MLLFESMCIYIVEMGSLAIGLMIITGTRGKLVLLFEWGGVDVTWLGEKGGGQQNKFENQSLD